MATASIPLTDYKIEWHDGFDFATILEQPFLVIGDGEFDEVEASGQTAVALQFHLPSDFNPTDFSAATIDWNLRVQIDDIVLAEIGILNDGTQEIPTTAGETYQADVASDGIKTFGFNSPAPDYPLTETPADISINVLTAMQAAAALGRLDALKVVFIARVSDPGWYGNQVRGGFTPTLELTYVPIEGPGGETLEGDTATFVVEGEDASLLTSIELQGARGIFVVTGNASDFDALRRIIGESGAFSVNGNVSVESFQRALVAQAGAVALSGIAAYLVGPGETIESDVGSIAVTTNDATFVDGSPFGCETGSLHTTGQAANQSISTPVAAGSLALTGVDNAFVIQPYVDAQGALILLSGASVSFDTALSSAAKHLYFHFHVRS